MILHYKNADITINCIDSILEQIRAEYSIVVVDNASANGSYEQLLKRYKDNRRIYFLSNEENLGYAVGNNIGFRFAKEKLQAQWIILLNNDVIIQQPDFLQVIEKEYEKAPFYVLGPDIVTPEGECQNPFRMQLPDLERVKKTLFHDRMVFILMKVKLQRPLRKLIGYNDKSPKKSRKDSIVDFTGVLHGSCLIFSKDFIVRFDGLYEGTFLYVEEEILCWILDRLGCRYSYSNQIQVVHMHAVSMQRAITDEDRRKLQILRWRIHSNRKFLKIIKSGSNVEEYLKQSR